MKVMIGVDCPEVKDGSTTHVPEEIKPSWTNNQAACCNA